VGRTAGPCVDLYNVLVLAVALWNIIKIRYLTADDLFLDVLQSATLIIFDYVFCLLPVAFLAREVVNSSVMAAPMRRKP
jgi:hypothetical protein